jgi:CheY-like chemotaxis protein
LRPTSDEERTAGVRGLDVLVVDDDPDALEIYCRMLELHGARVTCATSAATAVEHLDEGYTYQVLVSDIAMPGHDGLWLVRELRRRAVRGVRRVLAIAVTGCAIPSVHADAFEAGFDVFLRKPVDGDTLVAAVARYRGEPERLRDAGR